MKGRRDDSDGNWRDGNCQPPSEHDWRQFPPGSDACASVRAWLRDYADQDLDEARRRQIDEHVHACRDCGLALSRAELEVLRLKGLAEPVAKGGARGPGKESANDAPGGARLLRPPAGFTQGVLARVRQELAAEVAEVAAAEEVPGDFTPRVMARVRKEWVRPTLQQRALGFLARHRWPLVAALVVAAVVFVVESGRGTPLPRIEVVTASRAFVARGDRQLEAQAARQVQPGEQLEVQDGGHAMLRFAGGDARWDRPADLDVDGHALLELTPAAGTEGAGGGAAGAAGGPDALSRLVLQRGTVRLWAYEALALDVADAAALELEAGHYELHVLPVTRIDGALAGKRAFVAVRLEVFEGRARIRRGELRVETVAAGEAAHFDPWSRVRIERSDPRLYEESREHRPPLATQRGPARDRWIGRVIEGVGKGVANASVQLITLRGPQTVTTDAEGRFSVFGLTNLENTFAIVQVTPPREGLAAFGPAPVRLEPIAGAGGDLVLEPIVLEGERPLAGRVATADQRPLGGARIEPCLLDELFGLLQPLSWLTTESDEQGRFRVHGLPQELAPHVSLVLIVRHTDHPVAAHMALAGQPLRLWPKAVDVAVPDARQVRLVGLPPNASLDVVQSIPGLPLGAISVVHRVTSDALGEAVLAGAGPGVCWLRHDDGGTLVWLRPEPAPGGGEPWLRPDGAKTAAVPRALHDWLATRSAYGADRDVFRVGGTRYATMQDDTAPQPCLISVVDAKGPVTLPGTRVFLVPEDGGPIVFLGEFDGKVPLSFRPPREGGYTLFGVAPDGAVGLLGSDAAKQPLVLLAAAAPGGARLHKALQPGGDGSQLVGWFELEHGLGGMLGAAAGGPALGFHRVLERSRDWMIDGLIAGTYRVQFEDGRLARCYVESGRVAWIQPLQTGGAARPGRDPQAQAQAQAQRPDGTSAADAPPPGDASAGSELPGQAPAKR